MPKHLWTPEEARAHARKGAEATKAYWLNRKLNPPPPEPAIESALPPDVYSSRRLVRVRYQLELLDNEIERELKCKEPDGQRIDRLAAASMRLSDQEFALANRPKPGQLRPIGQRVARRRTGGASPPGPAPGPEPSQPVV